MTLPSSGPLSMSAINTEFGLGNNLGAYRGVTWYTDAGSSGTFTSTNLGMDQFYSKRATSPTFTFSIASNQTNANLRSLAVAAGWSGSGAVIATVNAGVWIYSTSTGTPGLTINGSFPGGVTLINNGNIIGMGGAGNNVGSAGNGNGEAGGSAISLGVNCTITNNSYIAGGGGGSAYGFFGGAGGGAGGGQGGGVTGWIANGGAGGGIGASGSNGTSRNGYPYGKGSTVTVGAGGGGGRILPGTGGAGGTWNGGTYGRGGGAGGGGGCADNSSGYAGGGAGGSAGSAGTSKTNPFVSPGGGGWGAAGGNYVYSSINYSGGAGGKAVALNGYSVTWNATGTRYGAIS